MAKRITTTKKSAAKKAPVKRATTPRKGTKSSKASTKQRSFKLAPETQPFIAFKVTEQTVYWLIFTMAILFLGLWILKINLQVQDIYDQIDQNRISQMETDDQYEKALAAQRNKD